VAKHVAHSGRVELCVCVYIYICTQYWSENLEESGCKEIIGVNQKIILKWTTQKQSVKEEPRLKGFGTASNGRPL
jgi:hypothetical protein